MDEWINDNLGLWDGRCQGCDAFGRVDDLGLCEDCAVKLERDLIRAKNWDYCLSTVGLTPARREALRKNVIRRYGLACELVVESERSEPTRHSRKRRRSRK